MRVDTFATRWVNQFPRGDQTNRNRRYYARKIAEDFEGRTIKSIKRLEAYEWARRNRNAARVARTMFNDARRVGLVRNNPFENLGLPESSGRRDAAVPTEEEIRELEAAAPEKIAGMVTVAAYTGLRIGELLGLRPQDIDGDVAIVATQVGRNGRRRPLKGDAPPKRVLVPPAALEALPYQRDPRARFWPISYSQAWHAFNRARQAVGVDFDIHDLRHFCATWLRQRGVDTDDIAAQLGHRNDDLVRRLYAHRDQDRTLERLRQAA